MSDTERVWVRNRETLATRSVLVAEAGLLGDAWEQITTAQAAAVHIEGREHR
ncbi:hypothetical protein [Amnibacterium kyonggiense]|uniref:Uncharacterized protein n=1 Tax=Amnibacterium kyonggiense TaxID=595671 RepID=A0A4R7FJ36_9MICO|nr:hypothetical protein [Amnibacterium kyonggiense]TDS75922.1 hypothetical protein CLV52_3033 [Amnibacterium kyonggiense]